MSIDPLAVAAAGSADLAALIDAELAALAADAQALSALLIEGAVVSARVLPSNGLTDLIEIAGRRVAAALPPTVRPGDVLQVRVTGFDGGQIRVQLLTNTGPGVENAPPPGPQPAVPSASAPVPSPAAAIASPELTPSAGVPSVPVSQPGAAPSSTPPAATTAPPAAAVPSPPIPPAAPPATPAAAATATPVPPAAPGGGGTLNGAVSRATVAPASGEPAAPNLESPPRAPFVAPPQPTTIEARLSAMRATAAARAAAPGTTPVINVPSEAAARTPAGIVVPPSRFVAPPTIAPKAPVAAAGMAASAGPRATGLSAYTEPVALLRALKLPVTPASVASATQALQRPERLPAALAILERALPRASADPHVATLRTLLAFVGRIDPRSPTLATQIAAYVEHIVDGAEPKIATLLAAARAATPALPQTGAPLATVVSPGQPSAVPEAPLPNAAPQLPASPFSSSTVPAGAPVPSRSDAAATPPPGTTPGAGAPAPAAPAASPAAPPHAAVVPPLPAAVAIERSAALGVDLKQTMLAVAADPATAPSLGPALSGAISALTAMQVTAAQTLAANPAGIAFTVPLATPNGFANAHISVQRDAPGGRGAKVDGENFRVAFVLDTAHYGTVAIDLVTVGREVTIDVRAENGTAMRAFRDALGRLTGRLEALRYRVAAAGASVGVTSTVAAASAPSAPLDPDAAVDRSV